MTMTHDAADDLALFELEENPERWENAVRAEQVRARESAEAARVLESIYCDEDRARAFDRFAQSYELKTLRGLLDRAGIGPDQRICEIGGGPGWLGWALHRAGYRSLEMLEPNGHHNTGTGYLRTREDARAIKIWNDLAAWYASPERYDVALTHNCVHHFRNLSYVAACIRKKLRPGGLWLMVREWYADTPEEVYQLLRAHPYSQRYGVFEYPLPAAHYVEGVELAGFRLRAAVPAGYANDTLALYVQSPGGLRNRLLTGAIDLALERAPAVTAGLYRAERVASLLVGPRFQRFTRPQALLFERVEVAS